MHQTYSQHSDNLYLLIHCPVTVLAPVSRKHRITKRSSNSHAAMPSPLYKQDENFDSLTCSSILPAFLSFPLLLREWSELHVGDRQGGNVVC